MKRLIALLTALLLLCCSVCAAAADPLADQAIDIGATMRRLAASEAYVSMISGSPAITARCAELGRGDTEPVRVRCYSLDQKQLLPMIGGDAALSGMSDEVVAILLERVGSGLFSMLNAQSGAEALAAASSVSYGMSVAVDEVPASRFYILEYAVGTPIAVTVTPGVGAVSMSGIFLMTEDWEAILAEILPVELQPIDIE